MIIVKTVIIMFSLFIFLISGTSVINEYMREKKKLKKTYKLIISLLILLIINIFIITVILGDKKNIITFGTLAMIVFFIIFLYKKEIKK